LKDTFGWDVVVFVISERKNWIFVVLEKMKHSVFLFAFLLDFNQIDQRKKHQLRARFICGLYGFTKLANVADLFFVF